MVGSAILKKLKELGYKNLIVRTRDEIDLTNQKDVLNFFTNEKFNQVYLAAAKVGGILANHTYPADFLYQNLMIQTNVINASFQSKVKNLLFLGSSCIYPKFSKQPIKEKELLSGYLEKTNEPYAIAKIAGLKLCESLNRQYGITKKIDYRCVMPTNLYGPGDNYHNKYSHVIPSLIRRFHEAKLNNSRSVTVWGTGNVKREFLFVDDLADALIFIMNTKNTDYYKYLSPLSCHINVGSGIELSIKKLAHLIKEVTNYNGKIIFDKSKPDGTPRKLVNSSVLNKLGWKSKVNLKDGLKKTYSEYLSQLK